MQLWRAGLRTLGAVCGSAGSNKEPLFPDCFHFTVFCCYVGLFVGQGILVTASRNTDGTYPYNTTTVVLLTELFKLIAAVGLYARHNTMAQLVEQVHAHRKLCVLYVLPAFLYCYYNNIAFTNLTHYDAATYFLLLNFRTVATGIVFQILFNKMLTRKQWLALVLLTVGCIVKQLKTDSLAHISIQLDLHLLLMMSQVMSSCLAGVYNEYLLKETGAGVDIMVQNVFMYINSIAMNVVFLLAKGQLASAFTRAALADVLLAPSVLVIAVNNSASGIMSSLFLKTFNSILKSFAGACEIVISALIGAIWLGTHIDGFFVSAIVIVSCAMLLYSQQPVVNRERATVLPTTSLATVEKKIVLDSDCELLLEDDVAELPAKRSLLGEQQI